MRMRKVRYEEVRIEEVIEGGMGVWKCGKGVLGAFDLVGKKQEEVGGEVDHGGIMKDR